MVLDQGRNGRGGVDPWAKFKKPKVPKAPPQRGLGVAQLEKILREQEQNSHDPAKIAPPIGPFPSNFVGGGGGREIGGSGMVFPENDYFPSMDFPEKVNPNLPSPILLPTKDHQYPPWMMNHVIPSGSSTGVDHHPIEFPSNQRPFNYASIQPEQEKSVGTKRPWPFSPAEPQAPIYPNEVPSWLPQMHITEPPSSCISCGAIISHPGKETSRDTRKLLQPKMSGNKSSMDVQAFDFLSLGLAAPSSPPAQAIPEEFPAFCSFPSQESKDEYGGWSHQEPPYSSVPPKRGAGSAETATSSSQMTGGNTGDAVDLNLKLSLG
ncbi:uncharacterized protein LOC127793997 isoform X2 [Diospyros lotus]|uniref:uncharacterized protein LOC127793997 isoform X2 n=1 Tax=Diospyros lotus TaxID=55363 RepID=UPI002259A49A|nr:uncharacterized protein LOC127793997 isoform X2 [Diospyros lotus]